MALLITQWSTRKPLERLLLLLIFVTAIIILVIMNGTFVEKFSEILCLPESHLDHPLTEESLCDEKTHFHVVVVIDSAIKSFDNREAIRTTWGNESHYSHLGYKVRAFFTLGNPELVDADLRKRVLRERDEHKDIIFINIEEAYKNIIHKVMYGLKAAVRHCPDTDVVVKADDDIFVDIIRLYDNFMGDRSLSSSLWCTVNKNSAMRNPGGRWYVDSRIYGGDYPHYCFGSFYTLNMTALSVLMRMAYCEPWFWIDDVFIAGDLRVKANISIRSMSGEETQLSSGYNLDGKEVSMTFAKDLKIVYHHFISPAAMRYLWSLVLLLLDEKTNQTS